MGNVTTYKGLNIAPELWVRQVTSLMLPVMIVLVWVSVKAH